MNIPHLRKKLHMSQVAFAKYIGVHPLTVSRWERGETEPSRPVVLLLILIDHFGHEAVTKARLKTWRK